MKDLKVAAVQIQCVPLDVESNLKKIEFFTQQASKKDANIICFPELSVTGYFQPSGKGVNRETKIALNDIAETIPGPSSQILVKLSQDQNITILAGMLEKTSSDVLFNTHLIVTPNGSIGKYRKVHIPVNEYPYWRGGYKIPVFKHDMGILGVAICYDSLFPEMTRVLAIEGADLVFIPYAWGCKKWDREEIPKKQISLRRSELMKFLPSRAFDNKIYIVACNQVGVSWNKNYPWLEKKFFPGLSMIIDPRGKIIAETNLGEEDIIYADLKKECLMETRLDPHFTLRLRRPETYEKLVEKK